MLILSRRSGKAVMIGDEIVFQVLGVDENQEHVTIGIEAPVSIQVHQQEVYSRINDRKPSVVISHKPRVRVLVRGNP
ncbi:carbon storage regulator [Pseudomonas sp. MDT1-17]